MTSYNDKNLVFLIGPARSGTKLVRDILSKHAHIDKIPYDVNFVWIYNHKPDSDNLFVHDIRERDKRRMAKFLHSYRTRESNWIIEKTVSNSIRVSYIQSMFPGAKFIFLLRDGYDVVESVRRQWYETPELSYLIEKARSLPLSFLVKYGPRFVRKMIFKSSPQYYWGVRVPGLEHRSTLIEKVAYQWYYCVKSMYESHNQLGNNKVQVISYESFVRDPKRVCNILLSFLGLEDLSNEASFNEVSAENIGKGRKGLSSEELDSIESLVEDGNKLLKMML